MFYNLFGCMHACILHDLSAHLTKECTSSNRASTGSFPLSHPQRIIPPPPIEAVAAATCVFTENVFCESVDNAHKLQIASTFQEVECLLKLVEVNKQVFAITLLNKNLDHTAQVSIS